MSDHRLFGQAGVDELDGSELSLCCICGKTFFEPRTLHLHVALVHEKGIMKVPDTPPLAHSTSFIATDKPDTYEKRPMESEGFESGEDDDEGGYSDDSCVPQDLRVRRSPIDSSSSGSIGTVRLPPSLPSAPAPAPILPPSPLLIGGSAISNAASVAAVTAGLLPHPVLCQQRHQPHLHHHHHHHHHHHQHYNQQHQHRRQDVSKEAYESQSDAPNSGQSSSTDFPMNERLLSQTNSPAGKSYHCDLCNKYFTKSCNLNSHVKAVHKGVRAFHCGECQKSFSRNSDLQKHIDAVHKGLRPYECVTCQKRFSQKSSLKRHREAVHEGIKAFQCDYCSARFSYDVHLKRHIRAKHKSTSNNGANGSSSNNASNARPMAPTVSGNVSSNSLPSSPVFQATSLRQASM